jgi:uncharacterized membrane protein YfcA
MPVYRAAAGSGLIGMWPLIALSTAGVVAGTLAGTRFLRHVPDRQFRPMVAILLLALGTWMLFRVGGAD